MKRENTQLIKDILREFIKEEHLEDGLQRVRIFGAWDLVVGDAGARATASKFFRDGILYCTINSSIIRTQFYYRKEEIALKINKMLNDNIVRKIVLK